MSMRSLVFRFLALAVLTTVVGCGCGDDDDDASAPSDDDTSDDDTDDDDVDDDAADDDTWPPLPDDDNDDDADDDTELPPLPDPSYGWILLDSDRAHVSWVLNQAADYGIDHVQLSHGLIMDIDEINEDAGHAADLRDIAQEAKSLDLEVWVWSHEFARESYLLCLDPEDDLWVRRAQAYRDALTTIPEIDGVILMFGSAEVEPWYAVCLCEWCAEQPDTGNPVLDLINSRPSDRLAQIYDTVGGVVMGEFGKKLRVRTFMHQPLEILWLGESLRAYPNYDLSVMTKDVPQDWQPYYPDDPLIGNVGHRHQIIEMDLGNEYWGQSRILNGQVDYIARRWAYDEANGALGAAARIERGSEHAFGNPNEINIYAYSRIVIDGATPDDIYREWFDAKYGIDGAEPEADVLKRIFRTSHDAMRKMYYTLGMWTLVKGSDVPDSARFPEQLVSRNTAYYDGDWWETSEDLAFPDEQTLADLWQEASEAVEIAQDNLDALESIEPAFTDPSQYDELHDMLALHRDACLVWRHVKDAMFRYMYSPRGHADQMPIIEWDLEQLADLADAINVTWGAGATPVRPGDILYFIADLRDGAPDIVDETPVDQPLLFDIDAEDLGGGEWRVTWESDVATTSRVEWTRKLPLYTGDSGDVGGMTTTHDVTIQVDQPGLWFFRVSGETGGGDLLRSGDYRIGLDDAE